MNLRENIKKELRLINEQQNPNSREVEVAHCTGSYTPITTFPSNITINGQTPQVGDYFQPDIDWSQYSFYSNNHLYMANWFNITIWEVVSVNPPQSNPSHPQNDVSSVPTCNPGKAVFTETCDGSYQFPNYSVFHHLTIDGQTPQVGDEFDYVLSPLSSNDPATWNTVHKIYAMNLGQTSTGTHKNFNSPTQPCSTSSGGGCMNLQVEKCFGGGQPVGTIASYPCATINGQTPTQADVGLEISNAPFSPNSSVHKILSVNPTNSTNVQDLTPTPCPSSCDTTTASPCAVQWWQNPNATWASNWITNRDCSNYTWPATNLEAQADAIMAGAPTPVLGPYNGFQDIWDAGNNSGLVNPQKGQFIGKMAKAKYSQCQKVACNC
jgi:hypothetical protein|tara:strand:- start:31 stop:1170 length:1140 start_codon:yes stop_codon:yes gene_type:complete